MRAVRRSVRPVLLALTAIAVCETSAAAAEPTEPPITLAVVSGVATALIPVGLGALHTANADTDGTRNVGFAVAGAGLALVPIVTHAVLGEWKRAAAFAAPGIAAEIAACVIMATHPDAVFHGTMFSRTGFALVFSADFFGAAASIVDVMLARERIPARPRDGAIRDLIIAPRVGDGQIGLVVGGRL